MLSRRRWSSIDCWLYKVIIAQTCINWIYCQGQIGREITTHYLYWWSVKPCGVSDNITSVSFGFIGSNGIFYCCPRQLNFSWAIISSINWVINSEYDNMLMRTTQRVDFIGKICVFKPSKILGLNMFYLISIWRIW